MEKIFRLQRLSTVLYALIAILVLIFSLFFLTDFKDLFGLELKVNQDVAYFHDTVLQGFNQKIFIFALCLIAGIAIAYVLEIFGKVPDLFALIIMCVFLVSASVISIYFIISIASISEIYGTLDFSKIALEGAIEYVPNTRTFIAGKALFSVSAVLCALFAAVLVSSHITYRRKGI